MRFPGFIVFGVLIALALLVYDLKHATRRLEARTLELARTIAEERDNLAVMRAEWAHVARPERIEALARQHLDLRPVAASRTIDRAAFIGRDVVASIAPPAEPARDMIGALIVRPLP